MLYKHLIVFSLFTGVLTGCGSMPKTADLLVENAQGGKMFSQKDSFVVHQPVSRVAAVLKEKSAECLQRKVTSSHWEQQGSSNVHRVQSVSFTPIMQITKERARLTVQLKDVSQGTTNLGGMPPDGWYAMVVDAYPVDKSTTRVESYFQDSGYDVMHAAVKPWVTGTNTGCPDLTQ